MYGPGPLPALPLPFTLRRLTGSGFLLSRRIVWMIVTVAMMFAHTVKTAPIMSLISIAVHLLSVIIY